MEFNEEALEYHRGKIRPGKIGTSILTRVEGKRDLSLAYSPGVAFPCLEIEKNPESVYEYTGKGNRVAVISNGTAVLGLGNIGAAAGKPVMEGKALLFKYFGGIDAVDVEIDSEDVDEIVRTVELISGTYGGINLEDFKAPECFEIEERLKAKLGIPVFHDDQHGTAVVVGAGLMNALRVAGKEIGEMKVVINGAGAAGIAIGKMLRNLGVKNIVMCDSRGIISTSRKSEVRSQKSVVPQKIGESSTPAISSGSLDGLNKYKSEFAVNEEGCLVDAVCDADVFIGVSKKDLLTPEMLLSMAKNPIVFALANPNPEIGWDVAHETRDDVIMATGRSDFPNQVNNVLAFPGIFRGALDCRASEINEEMKRAAAFALARLVGSEKLVVGSGQVSRIIPDPFDERILIEVAVAVSGAAVESDVCGEFDLGEYRKKLEKEFLSGEKNNPRTSTDEHGFVGKRFRHFKGKEYEVVAIGWDSESLKRVVVYRALYDDEKIWVRDFEEFISEKEVDGKVVKRFERIGNAD